MGGGASFGLLPASHRITLFTEATWFISLTWTPGCARVCDCACMHVCSVNVGCVPKKIMFNAASVFEAIHQAKFVGITVDGEPKLDWWVISTRISIVQTQTHYNSGCAPVPARLGLAESTQGNPSRTLLTSPPPSLGDLGGDAGLG